MSVRNFPIRVGILCFLSGAVVAGGIYGVLQYYKADVATRMPAESEGIAVEHESEAQLVALPETSAKNIGLRVVDVKYERPAYYLRLTGIVKPNQNRVADIRPLARGRITDVRVTIGDRVREGQALIELDNVELGQLIGEYVSTFSSLQKARAEAEVAKRFLDRARQLIEVGAISRAELERREAEWQNALAAINVERARLSNIEEQLHRFGLEEEEIQQLRATALKSFHSPGLVERAGAIQLRTSVFDLHRQASHEVLTAPFSGVVINLDAAVGEVADPSRVLLSLADLSTVWVLADVYQKDLAYVRVGQEARVTVDSYPGKVFLGKVTYVSDFLDPETRTAKVRCLLRNEGNLLRLDMFVNVDLVVRSDEEKLVVPSDAVQYINDESVVFVEVAPGRYEKRVVRIGRTYAEGVEVIEGLKAGERIVSQGSFYLKASLLRELIGEEH